MRIIELRPEQAHEITDHGSHGFRAQAVVRADSVAATVLRVAAGGQIGRHPATVDQLFVVVSGRAEVCGEDGVWHGIQADQAALWLAGEHHTTRAAHGDVVAIAIEFDGLATRMAV
jgi:mannose-6-phosphate isomerase-like protein (cupin superfamily)